MSFFRIWHLSEPCVTWRVSTWRESGNSSIPKRLRSASTVCKPAGRLFVSHPASNKFAIFYCLLLYLLQLLERNEEFCILPATCTAHYPARSGFFPSSIINKCSSARISFLGATMSKILINPWRKKLPSWNLGYQWQLTIKLSSQAQSLTFLSWYCIALRDGLVTFPKKFKVLFVFFFRLRLNRWILTLLSVSLISWHFIVFGSPEELLTKHKFFERDQISFMI